MVTAALVMSATACQKKSGTPSGAEPGEPMVLPEFYAHSLAAAGYPGAKRAFQVGHGSVVYSGDAALEWTLRDSAATVSPVYFEKDGVPVAHWFVEGGGVRLHFEAAAAPFEALGDTSLLLSVLVSATRIDAGTGELVFDVRVRGRPDGPYFLPWDAVRVATWEEAWDDYGAVRNGLVVAAIDPRASIPPGGPTRGNPATTEGDGPGALEAVCRATLARGETRAWHFVMPAFPTTLDANSLRDAGHAAMAARARADWRRWLSAGARFETPDTLVNAAWRAALVTLIQSQEPYGGDWLPMGNPFQYRDVWIRDGARVVRALAVAGHTGRARENAWSFRHFQLPGGALLSQRGQLDGTGQALWAFEQAATIPPDPKAAAKFLPVAERALDWIELQRRASRELGVRYRNMLPYGDPRDAELVRAQLVGNDAWAIAGCRSVMRLARSAGNDDLARRAFRIYTAYLGDFDAALTRTQRDDVPPTWQRIGRDWGNLNVGYPTRALPPENVRLLYTARRVWAQARRTTLVNYGPSDSLHSYLGADLAQWALLANRSSIARAYVNDLLEYSSSTLGQAEIFNRRGGGFGFNLPPHSTAAATLIDLLRNMIVNDTRDTLDLALGGDLSWWSGTRFTGAPTRFGIVDVTLERPARNELQISWGGASAPARIRVPDGASAVESLTPGARVVSPRWIHCAPGIRRAAFRVRVNR